jgi:hypothetical protein
MNELFSAQEIGKTRMLESEESRHNPSRSFCWARRGENEEEETSARKVEKE